MKKNLFLLTISFFVSILFFYIIFFTYNFFLDHEKNPYLFNSIEDVNFNKFYSKKIHHLRGHNTVKDKSNNRDYIFSVINSFENKNNNILMQGDSWIEQIVEKNNEKSYKEIYDFAYNNKLGLVNSGTTSYSPSLMQIQFDILEKDFNIKPNIVISYVDQTDIGDELCRYKNNKKYDSEGKLISVVNTNYSRAVFEYTKINNISEIVLSNNSKLIKNYKLTNFFIKYSYKRLLNKIKIINKYGWSNRDSYKCNFPDIIKYLHNINSEELAYFENRVKDYIKFLLEKKYVDKIIIVTFPHYNHLFEKNSNYIYNVDVSDVVEKLTNNQKKIYHLNFSRLIRDNKITINNNSYKNDKAHLKEKFYIEIFLKNLKKTILENLY